MRAMCGCVDNSAMKFTSRDRAKAKPGSDLFFHKRLRPFYCDQLEGDGNLER